MKTVGKYELIDKTYNSEMCQQYAVISNRVVELMPIDTQVQPDYYTQLNLVAGVKFQNRIKN